VESQFSIPHPLWMDFPPWQSLRDRLIRNQHLYSNSEFQFVYLVNLTVNWTGSLDDMFDIVADARGKIQVGVSKAFKHHAGNIKNIALKKPFFDRYPELSDAYYI
jgi:hypothetical protein